MSDKVRLIAGAMSGTSGDGVDVALVRIIGSGLQMQATLLKHHHIPFDPSIRSELFAIRDSGGKIALSELARLGRNISLTYARAVNEALSLANLRADDIAAIAAHGQTLYHDPPNTIQWFDPSLVAAEVGCAVVSDFRRADCAAGGQGAPLVPFADYILFRDPTKNRVLLNLGGIANITWLPAGATPGDIIGFDTGPANCVIDHLARKADLPDGMDRNGALALAGQPNEGAAIAAMLLWPKIRQKPPKSADTPEMIALFEQVTTTPKAMNLPDLLATACTMSRIGIQYAVLEHLPAKPDEIIASGGGVNNPRLMQEIRQNLNLPVRTTDEFGVPCDSKEAIAFALLGAATLDGIPSNIPSVTGAKRPVVLGSITPKP